jgi:hypothetical protein
MEQRTLDSDSRQDIKERTFGFAVQIIQFCDLISFCRETFEKARDY